MHRQVRPPVSYGVLCSKSHSDAGRRQPRPGACGVPDFGQVPQQHSDGDWVVVRQQEDAGNGDIVAAMLDGEATVKTFKRSDGHAWLIPHNPAYTPILGDDASILGRVMAVLRRVL